METLSGSLVSAIFDECSLRDALHASYTSRVWRKILIPYLINTYNLQKYLSPFHDSKSLLKVFRETGAILSGGRALAYFLPRLRRFSDASQDWDIFVPFPNYELVHKEIVSQQGFYEVERTKKQPYEKRFLVHDYLNDENIKVQVVALTPEWSMYDCIMDFHVSVVQNGITGWGCFMLNWEYTFADRGWLAERLSVYPEYQEKARMKYANQGISIVPWTEWKDKNLLARKVFVVLWKQGRMGEDTISLTEWKALLSVGTQ
jgi:hypothetical protein